MSLGRPGIEGTSRRQASLEGVQRARQGLPGRSGWGGGLGGELLEQGGRLPFLTPGVTPWGLQRGLEVVVVASHT